MRYTLASPEAPGWATTQLDPDEGSAYWYYQAPVWLTTFVGDATEPMSIALERIDSLDETESTLQPGVTRIRFNHGSEVDVPVDQLDQLIDALTDIRDRYRVVQGNQLGEVPGAKG